MILGIGLVFYGMNMMGDATSPSRSYQPFIDMLAHAENPRVGHSIQPLVPYTLVWGQCRRSG
jgi:Na+/phosphate symporter